MADVVMGHPFDVPQPQREDGLRAIQRLDLRFFIDTQHERLVRPVEVETHDIPDLLHK